MGFVLSRRRAGFLALIAVMVVSGLAFSLIVRPEPAAAPERLAGDWSFRLSAPAAFAGESGGGAVSAVPSVPGGRPALADLSNLVSLERDGGVVLSAAQRSALAERGFFLAEDALAGSAPQHDDFVDLYLRFRGTESPAGRQAKDAVFVTSDVALHLYHILVGRTFQETEESRFQPMLREMTQALFLDSLNGYRTAVDPKLKESYGRLAAYYLVPLVVLDASARPADAAPNPGDFATFAEYLAAEERQRAEAAGRDLEFALEDPEYAGEPLDGTVFAMARDELRLILEARGSAPSPIFTPLRPDLENDYSQFRPRSHYTKSDALKGYFIAMMWYGRMGFPLSSPDLTRDALIATAQIANLSAGDRPVREIWSAITAAVDFFVGEDDDLTALHYAPVAAAVYGDGVSPAALADDRLLGEFVERARRDLPNPKIVSELVWAFDDGGQRDAFLADLKQFRLMGQRFTPDAYVLSRLTQGIGAPEPETGQMLPSMPTALMAIRAFAPESRTVRARLDDWILDPERIAAQGRESDRIIAKTLAELDAEFAAEPAAVWEANLYRRWLDAFRVLLRGYGEGYPAFMRTDAWQEKNLGTALGSFAELKHDTLLYAKQSYAEMGAGGFPEGEIPPVPQGYVEPDLEFWNRIVSLAETARSGLAALGVMPESYAYKHDLFIDVARFLRDTAAKQLSGQPVGEEGLERLRTVGGAFARIVEPVGGQSLSDSDRRSGLIADIHTDGVKGQILYQATGRPLIVYAAVADADGTRLVRGAVFSHYEITGSRDRRLADEDWQAVVYGDGEMPDLPPWTAALVP